MKYTLFSTDQGRVAMAEPDNKLFCRSDAETVQTTREQQRLKVLSELGLLEAQTIPVFEEATQTAAHLLDSPICILGVLDHNRHWFKSAVGLSRLGLMNQLAQERQLPRDESLCTNVVESLQILAISDALNEPAFANNFLVQYYGIRAYLGVPLFTAARHCVGAIAVMDLQPRTFNIRDIKFLEIIARWSMSEFERSRQFRAQEPLHVKEIVATSQRSSHSASEVNVGVRKSSSPNPISTIQVKLELLGQLTQELRTPLTSVLGMAGVVGREIYGPLTNKQKEYLEIIQHSGRYLLSLVNEISELRTLDESNHTLNLTSVDIEMLSQQAISTLEEAANRREQEIRLSVEPGRSRIWVLDKDKVRQLLYHLVFIVIQVATTGSVIHIRVSHKNEGLNIAISASHPWLGDGLTQVDPYFCQLPNQVVANYLQEESYDSQHQQLESLVSPLMDQPSDLSLSSSGIVASLATSAKVAESNSYSHSRESLRLLLSCHLAELHGGQISIQGTPESGYRYVVILPEQVIEEESV